MTVSAVITLCENHSLGVRLPLSSQIASSSWPWIPTAFLSSQYSACKSIQQSIQILGKPFYKISIWLPVKFSEAMRNSVMMLSSTKETWLPQIQHPIFKLLAFSYHHPLMNQQILMICLLLQRQRIFPPLKICSICSFQMEQIFKGFCSGDM